VGDTELVLVSSGSKAEDDPVPPTEGPLLLYETVSSCSEAEDDPVPTTEGSLLPCTLPSAQPPPPCVGEKEPTDLPPQASERGSPGPGEGGTPEVPFHLVQYATPEPIKFYSLEACGSSIFESPVVGSAGAPPLSCYFGFGASTLGSEFSLSPWGTGPSGEGRGPDPAPGDSNLTPPPLKSLGRTPPPPTLGVGSGRRSS